MTNQSFFLHKQEPEEILAGVTFPLLQDLLLVSLVLLLKPPDDREAADFIAQ